METTYYIIENGRQTGPIVREELRYHNLTPETYVWREGLETWQKAGELPELGGLLYGENSQQQAPFRERYTYDEPAPYGRPQSYGYDQVPRPAPGPVPHTNWMPMAIVALVLGLFTTCISLILGIIAVVQANKANGYYAIGNATEGDRRNATTRTLCIVAWVLSGISIIASFFILKSGFMTELYEQLGATL